MLNLLCQPILDFWVLFLGFKFVFAQIATNQSQTLSSCSFNHVLFKRDYKTDTIASCGSSHGPFPPAVASLPPASGGVLPPTLICICRLKLQQAGSSCCKQSDGSAVQGFHFRFKYLLRPFPPRVNTLNGF